MDGMGWKDGRESRALSLTETFYVIIISYAWRGMVWHLPASFVHYLTRQFYIYTFPIRFGGVSCITAHCMDLDTDFMTYAQQTYGGQ